MSPSALKRICKECTKIIKERNRHEKIDNAEDKYICNKVKYFISRIGILNGKLCSIFSLLMKCSDI
jgi:hypothetical protein